MVAVTIHWSLALYQSLRLQPWHTTNSDTSWTTQDRSGWPNVKRCQSSIFFLQEGGPLHYKNTHPLLCRLLSMPLLWLPAECTRPALWATPTALWRGAQLMNLISCVQTGTLKNDSKFPLTPLPTLPISPFIIVEGRAFLPGVLALPWRVFSWWD